MERDRRALSNPPRIRGCFPYNYLMIPALCLVLLFHPIPTTQSFFPCQSRVDSVYLPILLRYGFAPVNLPGIFF